MDTTRKLLRVIDGRYEIYSPPIGKGGWGKVYKGKDRTLGTDIAVKALLPEFKESRTTLQRFKQEVIISQRLTHTNIIRVHHLKEEKNPVTGESDYYIIMNLVDGWNLNAWIKRNPDRKISEVLNILGKICRALSFAHHNANTFHRDIKPTNIMIQEDGEPIILDFGIAKMTDLRDQGLTGTYAIGTPGYMAPEQEKGISDYRVDIYAMTVLTYEMLLGASYRKRTTEEEKWLKTRFPRLWEVLLKGLQPNPEERYQNILDLLRDLESVLMVHGQDSCSVLFKGFDGEETTIKNCLPRPWKLWKPIDEFKIKLKSVVINLKKPVFALFSSFKLKIQKTLLDFGKKIRQVRIPTVNMSKKRIFVIGVFLIMISGMLFFIPGSTPIPKVTDSSVRLSLREASSGRFIRDFQGRYLVIPGEKIIVTIFSREEKNGFSQASSMAGSLRMRNMEVEYTAPEKDTIYDILNLEYWSKEKDRKMKTGLIFQVSGEKTL